MGFFKEVIEMILELSIFWKFFKKINEIEREIFKNIFNSKLLKNVKNYGKDSRKKINLVRHKNIKII